ncbi:hypothetical protein Dsin_016461 [Dipteronia sinensis]|uniref:Reverse transcriptase domain-containing protein n=1 Tax=Dipteronia sinensis TaxID=43782 RepID=A0AAE0AD51_9ROSI|nr:hypothetical protein Dsin_016461 [Dipteronia sinensis]
MAIKFDMVKAYNHVKWNFIGEMMRKLGFPVKWIQLIMNCISIVSYSFMLNREVCGYIKPTKGLKQGDHISSYLFLICAEGFSSLIDNVVSSGKLSGFKCSKKGPVLSHLFFADDSLIFSKANEANCVAIREILDVYAMTSGQFVNLNKSAMCISHSMSAANGVKLASNVSVNLVNCLDRYLGLPCFIGRSKRKLFSDITDKVWNKIKGWGERFLSVGRKKILIKAVIQAIPIYTL